MYVRIALAAINWHDFLLFVVGCNNAAMNLLDLLFGGQRNHKQFMTIGQLVTVVLQSCMLSDVRATCYVLLLLL